MKMAAQDSASIAPSRPALEPPPVVLEGGPTASTHKNAYYSTTHICLLLDLSSYNLCQAHSSIHFVGPQGWVTVKCAPAQALRRTWKNETSLAFFASISASGCSVGADIPVKLSLSAGSAHESSQVKTFGNSVRNSSIDCHLIVLTQAY